MQPLQLQDARVGLAADRLVLFENEMLDFIVVISHGFKYQVVQVLFGAGDVD